jgi:hypothetical protein
MNDQNRFKIEEFDHLSRACYGGIALANRESMCAIQSRGAGVDIESFLASISLFDRSREQAESMEVLSVRDLLHGNEGYGWYLYAKPDEAPWDL